MTAKTSAKTNGRKAPAKKTLTPQERIALSDKGIQEVLDKYDCTLRSEPVVVRVPIGNSIIHALDSQYQIAAKDLEPK